MNCANHPDRERVAFCQNCGKPLCSECTRTIGTAVFCEPCLAARLAAADTNSATGTPYGNVNVPYGAVSPVPVAPGAPNPVLAGLLGIIPGVGAMYNGQYAKGVVHLVVFAVLVSLADSNGVFGLFIAGWVFYQIFEAYHTARARRDGTSLPNPFGLNDIGEKLGFGKSWTGTAPDPSVPTPPSYTAAPPPASYTTQSASQGFTPSGVRFTESAERTQPYPAPAAYSNVVSGASGGPYVPPVAPNTPYGAAFSPQVDLVSRGNRFPVGAILLIGFGILFFFGSSGWFNGFPIQRTIPFLLIALSVWVFIRKMTNTGLSVSDDGTPGYRMRLIRALRSSVWLFLLGVLFFLDTFNILSWSRSWPLFIIVAGIMALLERSAYTTSVWQPSNYATEPPAGSTSSATSGPSSNTTANISVVPAASHDEEGR